MILTALFQLPWQVYNGGVMTREGHYYSWDVRCELNQRDPDDFKICFLYTCTLQAYFSPSRVDFLIFLLQEVSPALILQPP